MWALAERARPGERPHHPATIWGRRLFAAIASTSGANRLHWVRDVTFDEDRSQVRTGAAPQVLAGLRNLVISLVRRAGHSNVAAALRRHNAHLSEAFDMMGFTYQAGE